MRDEFAKEYHENIIKQNSNAEAYGLDNAYIAGYNKAVELIKEYINKNFYDYEEDMTPNHIGAHIYESYVGWEENGTVQDLINDITEKLK